MIHVSDRWRFIAALEDKGFYSDDVVQHTLLDHRGVRRAFSEKFCADTAACEELRRQTKLAARCNPPALPRIYQIEMLDNQISVIFEQVEGRLLDDLIGARSLESMREWTTYALKILDEAIEMRRAGAKFERMDPAHIVVTDGGDLRLTQRSPIGKIAPAAAASSPVLQRLSLQERIGVYTSTEQPDEIGEMKVLKEIFLRMASANPKITFEEFLPNVRSLQYGTGGRITEVILMMHSGGGRPPALDQIRSRVQEMHREEMGRYLYEITGGMNVPKAPERPSMPSSPTPQPVHTPAVAMPAMPTPVPMHHSDEENPYATFLPGVTPAAPTPIPRASVPTPAPLPESHIKSRPASLGDETVNPWAAAESAAGLHPIAPGAASDGPGELSRPQPRAPVPVIVKPKAEFFPTLLKVLGVLLAIAAVGALGYFAFDALTGRGGKERPVVVLKMPESSMINLHDRVLLDASASHDPDGGEEPLTFNWKVTPREASVVFSDFGSARVTEKPLYTTKAPRIHAQFFTAGEITLELQAHDGTMFSDPVSIIFEVRIPEP